MPFFDGSQSCRTIQVGDARTWVASALDELAQDGKCVGTTELNWEKIEAFAREYVRDKTASGRYQSAADITKPKPTWDMLENKETVP